MTADDTYRKNVVGQSKSGAPLVRHENSRPRDAAIDDERIHRLAPVREHAFINLFGPWNSVYHELVPLDPHIDVFEFPPNADAGRHFFTYVTGGVSDRPMNSPPELGADVRRIEFVFYTPDANQEYADLLHNLAAYVHECGAWLHWGHSMPNGTPPVPLTNTSFDHLFFMSPLFTPDSDLPRYLTMDDDPVKLLWCVPITKSECQLKIDSGADALYDLFQRYQHPFVFDRGRNCYA